MGSIDITTAVAAFGPAGRETLMAIMSRPTFMGVFTPEQTTELGRQAGLSADELILALVLVARAYAYAPISNYEVGAVARARNDTLILGANFEIPGLALNMTIHGEQAAILYARLLGHTDITALAVNGTPCGHCRQFLAEINDPDFQVITPQSGSRSLAAMLPNAFMPSALGNSQGSLDIQPRQLTVTPPSEDPLLAAAGRAAARSHAPYSGNWAGMAVQLCDDTILAASYCENVAFNPSVTPLGSILVAMQMQGRRPGDIQRAVLAEVADSLASQAPACQAILASLNAVSLEVVHVE